MRFNLDTCGLYYNEEEKNKLEKLGFEFDEPERAGASSRKLRGQKLYIDFSSLDELINFIKEYGRIVIQPPEGDEWGWNIEIYDDYRE